MTSVDLNSLILLTLRRPALAAEAILQADLPIGTRWLLAVLVAVLAAMLAWGVGAMVPTPTDGTESVYGWIADAPMVLAAMQLGAVILTAALMAGVGGLMGGNGRFEDALILTVWIEAVLMLVQAAQLVLLVVLPGLAALLSMIAVVLFFVLLVQFTKVLHGLRNGWGVLFAMIAAMFALGFVLSFIAAAFGLFPEVPV